MNLAVAIDERGTRVFGSGGSLRPGCNELATEDVITIPHGDQAGPQLVACLQTIAEVFPGEARVRVHAAPSLTSQQVREVLETLMQTPFDILSLGVWPPPPPDLGEVVDEPSRDVTGRVALGEVTSDADGGEFDTHVVTRLLQSRAAALRHCYERALRSDPSLAGRVRARFTIGESGRVEGVQLTEDTLGDADVGECVQQVIRRMRFNPGPEAGPVTVIYPFEFHPER